MIGKEVQATLSLALAEAKRRRHEFVCIEHLLFALLQDNDAGAAIVHCGGDIARLKKSLEEFFDTHMARLPAGMERGPQQTLGFHRVLQRTVLHAQSAEKKEIHGGDLLAAIFREPDSYAAYLLEEQGITRLDVINYISHGISKISTGEDWSVSREERGDRKSVV